MSLINDVKKALRDAGVETDADDVVRHLAPGGDRPVPQPPPTTVAELTCLECRGHDVVVVEEHGVVDEALVTGQAATLRTTAA